MRGWIALCLLLLSVFITSVVQAGSAAILAGLPVSVSGEKMEVLNAMVTIKPPLSPVTYHSGFYGAS